jgi:U4/U6 small nuclear ribonucleoprotein PRP31
MLQELGNTIDKSKNNEVLHEILTPATIMVVSVTASTTQGFSSDSHFIFTIFIYYTINNVQPEDL